MRIQQEKQLNPVADEVLALTGVVRPILTGVLYALKKEMVAEIGSYEKISLKMLSRLYKPGDGDCGICFEYAIHDAMNQNDTRVMERVETAMKLCRIKGGSTKSILFGAEKNGALQLIDTARETLTEDSSLLYGTAGRPAKLRRHIGNIVAAFKNPRTKRALPHSISGLWKADLFVGDSASDRWIGTTVKNNLNALEAAKGLRIGIVPTKQGKTDKVQKDENKNLIICPLAYDGDFMQTFYEGWQIVQAVIASDARVPSEVMLPTPSHRQVSRILAQRRDFPVLAVIEAIKPFAQPELLATSDKTVDLVTLQGETITDMLVAPLSRNT